MGLPLSTRRGCGRGYKRVSGMSGALGTKRQTDKQTDRQTYNNRSHLMHWAHAMRPNNNSGIYIASLTRLRKTNILVKLTYLRIGKTEHGGQLPSVRFRHVLLHLEPSFETFALQVWEDRSRPGTLLLACRWRDGGCGRETKIDRSGWKTGAEYCQACQADISVLGICRRLKLYIYISLTPFAIHICFFRLFLEYR